jgi:hypothetical protein
MFTIIPALSRHQKEVKTPENADEKQSDEKAETEEAKRDQDKRNEQYSGCQSNLFYPWIHRPVSPQRGMSFI